jgi:hypothetical protein
MAKVAVQIEVSKEAHELAQALKGIVMSAKAHLGDGFQPVADLQAIAIENFGKVQAGVAGVMEIPAEAKEDLEAFLNAWAIMGSEIAAELLKKPAAPAPAPAPQA